MVFRESKPIYLQIATFVCEKILLDEWKGNERIPSVRELAVLLEVNPNTVMRAYEFLQHKEIVVNERGIGLFASNNARKNAMTYCQSEFKEKEIPHFFRNLVLLEMDINELAPQFEKYKKKNFPQPQKKSL
jgi:GntR family transcriptional regulator